MTDAERLREAAKSPYVRIMCDNILSIADRIEKLEAVRDAADALEHIKPVTLDGFVSVSVRLYGSLRTALDAAKE